MRYMHKKIHFNKFELQELERRNPTLFDLAKYVADKAHITASVRGENWINVTRGNDETQLLCPSAVFHVPGTERKCGDPTCYTLRCWSMYNEPSENPNKYYRPCWFRRWNDFVSDMKYDYMEY